MRPCTSSRGRHGRNGYAESLNSKVWDELPSAEEFSSLLEARGLGKEWKRGYNHERPHSALGLTYLWHRWYANGHWLSEDPLGLGPDSNPYRYVRSDPAISTDPTGFAEVGSVEWYLNMVQGYQRSLVGSGIDWKTAQFHGPGTDRSKDAWTCKTTAGDTIVLWSSAQGEYHCHGLTFSGTFGIRRKNLSPIGNDVPKILKAHWKEINPNDARPMDIVVWFHKDGSANHSAVIVQTHKKGRVLQDEATRLLQKNGSDDLEIRSLEFVKLGWKSRSASVKFYRSSFLK